MILVTVTFAREVIDDGWPPFAALAKKLRTFGPGAWFAYVEHIETDWSVSTMFMVGRPTSPCTCPAMLRPNAPHLSDCSLFEAAP